jgi:hypothetical protein
VRRGGGARRRDGGRERENQRDIACAYHYLCVRAEPDGFDIGTMEFTIFRALSQRIPVTERQPFLQRFLATAEAEARAIGVSRRDFNLLQ